MSIDASVFRGVGGCAGFEKDGSVSFRGGPHTRTDSDIAKDDLLNVDKQGTLRFHHADAELWPLYVKHHLSTDAARVTYSGAYRACLRGEPPENDIIEASDL